MAERIRSVPWTSPPGKILIMRFQALGDVVIILPYILQLKQDYPSMEIHLLTRKEVAAIPRSLAVFDRVYSAGGGRNAKLQFLYFMWMLPLLRWQRYDAVVDLQNHRISKTLRKLLAPRAWAEFDRWSPLSAGERTRLTIEAAGFRTGMQTVFSFRDPGVKSKAAELLRSQGWDGTSELVILNPAGNLPSRSWPLLNYLEWARLWLARRPRTQFVVMLTGNHRNKSTVLKEGLQQRCINLSGCTSQVDAFAIVSMSVLMLTEDSGLMHMAWVQGVPTLALFGSSRKDWSAPQGKKSACLDSSDLECGPCMLAVCKFQDNRCLTRYRPEFVLEQAIRLLKSPE